MIRFRELGFHTFEEYAKEFFNSLLNTTKTYEYFVDWQKVKDNVKKYLNEISLLNSLTKVGKSKRKEYLNSLLNEYPKVIEVIPLLIAERVKNGIVDIFDTSLEKFIRFQFIPNKINSKIIPRIIEFCIKTGIIDLFDEVKDIYDYLLGIEVGIDTNARKNRSGEIFEKMCQQKIKSFISTKYKIVNNDSNFSLYSEKVKVHDIVIYKDDKPILVIECSFYNVPGSKPISTAESYIEMYKEAKKQKIEFLWVTDGPAWRKEGMKKHLDKTMRELDWVLNFKMLKLVEKILKYIP